MNTPSPFTGHAAVAGPQRSRLARVLASPRVWARVVLIPVAVIGAVLSFDSLYRAACPVFGDRLAYGFPLLVDALILGASLEYVAGAKVGRPRAGWRLTAHAGIAGTLVLNALAARTPAEVPWHIVAPAVWSVLVELTARQTLGEWKAANRPPTDAIPLRLWLTAFGESLGVWLRMARRLDGEQAAARLEVGRHAAAVEALKLDLPGRRGRRTRRILRQQLRLGSIVPADIPSVLGWLNPADTLTGRSPRDARRAALSAALLAGTSTRDGTPPLTVDVLDLTTASRQASRMADAATDPDLTNDPVVASNVAGGQLAMATDPDLANHPVVASNVAGGQFAMAVAGGHEAGPTLARPGQIEPVEPGQIQGGQVQEGVATAGPATRPVADSAGRTPSRPSETRRAVAAVGHPHRQVVAAPVHDTPPAGVSALTPDLSTGDKLQDGIRLLRADPSLTGRQMGERLRQLGWAEASDRTGGRILSEARKALASQLRTHV